jgi:predicted dehydrogenase
MLGWCALLLDGEPRRVLAAGPQGEALTSVLLDYGDGRAAHLIRAWVPAGRPSWQVQVAAEHGSAVAEPGQVQWRGPEGRCSHSPGRPRPAAQVLLTAFRQALAEGRAPRPSLADAHRLLRWLRLAARSRAEGGWVSPESS